MTEHGLNQRVDKDGVLELIQKLRYDGNNSTFVVTFFNGLEKIILSELVVDEIIWSEPMGREPFILQAAEAKEAIEELALEQWQDWFPVTKGAQK